MRGYFGIGVEGISKPMNVGNLFRSTHAFGGMFFFTIRAACDAAAAVGAAEREMQRADTAGSAAHVPYYGFDRPETLLLPRGCRLVGVELVDAAVALPAFRHPRQAAYLFGPEKGSLSPAALERCDFVVRIPMAFCVNVGVAGAIVMYDRLISLGRFPRRPERPGAPPEPLPPHVRGGRVVRTATAD